MSEATDRPEDLAAQVGIAQRLERGEAVEGVLARVVAAWRGSTSGPFLEAIRDAEALLAPVEDRCTERAHVASAVRVMRPTSRGSRSEA